MSERPAWDVVARGLGLQEVIGILNSRMPRWATLLTRVQRKRTVSTSADLVLTSEMDVILVDATSAVTLSTLASASQFNGHTFYIKRVAGAQNVTFNPAGAETIDGAGSATMNQNIVICNGSSWQSW